MCHKVDRRSASRKLLPMSDRTIGVLMMTCGVSIAAGGLWLARRYAAAASDTSLLRRHPRHHGWLGLLGQLLVVLGLVLVMIGGMIGFA